MSQASDVLRDEHQGGQRRRVIERVERFAGVAAEWDGLARNAPGFTHFHLYGWRAVVERVFGHECIYLAAYDDAGALAGVLPLVRVKSILFGHFLVSMPFLNYGGPLGTSEAIVALVAHASKIARESGVKLLELRSRIELPIEMPVSHRKITVILELPNSEPALMKQLDAKLRSQVRRPQKEGVTMKFGADQVAPFFEVFAHHMRDLGTPTQSRLLFETIAAIFPDDAWFGCAWYQGRPVACGCAFHWGDELEMTWASSLNEHKRIAPNMLLYYRFMERAIERGIAKFNFGRTSPNSGTHRFKTQWGTHDEQLFWYDKAATADVKTPSPTDSGYSWGPRIWKMLPTPVATMLGPRIVRYIP
ncbi:MAG: FemAB family PEP-CTERM system-associated protein [Gemmatimonadaceae bacterium]|nr:FemAB family PEP-CTERM system-associated protein [Gemmatimonadaceae bacterium]